MSSKSQSRVARPMNRSEIERQELAGAIRRALPRDGRVEMQPGLTLFRVSTPTEPIYGISESSFCVIAQGAKHVMLGEDRFRYDPNHYLISTVGLPTISQIDGASSEEPYVGLPLILDPSVVTSTMVVSCIAKMTAASRPLPSARLIRICSMPACAWYGCFK